MRKHITLVAKLTLEEVIAVVLFSGPMSVVYNAILRRYPADLYQFFKESGNTFSTTICVLMSAVQKLSSSSGTKALYLGPDSETFNDLFVQDIFTGERGFIDWGFRSLSADKNLALRYSGVKEGNPRAVVYAVQQVDPCADISEFSQYPGEKEYVFLPASLIQSEGRQGIEVDEGGAVHTLVYVRVYMNTKAETVEQMLWKKKSMHIDSSRLFIQGTEQWLQTYAEESSRAHARAATDQKYEKGRDLSWFISETMGLMQSMNNADAMLPYDAYEDDRTYKALVTRMLSSQEWAKQKLRLWLENQETNIETVGKTPLKSAHRQWLSFLKRQHAVAVQGSVERKTAAVKILQCKGLMVTNDLSWEEAPEGEPLIHAAAADGWSVEDLQVMTCASCSGAARSVLRARFCSL